MDDFKINMLYSYIFILLVSEKKLYLNFIIESGIVIVKTFLYKSRNIFLYIYVFTIFIFSYQDNLNNFSNIIFLILFFLTFVYKRLKIKIDISILSFFIFILYISLGMFYANDKLQVITSIRTMMLLLLLVIVLINSMDNKMVINNVLKCVIIANAISLAYSIFQNGFTLSQVASNTSRLSGTMVNQNTFGINQAIASSIAFFFVSSSSEKKQKLIYFILGAILTLGVIISGSRTAIIGFLVSNTGCIFASNKKSKVLKSIAFIIAIILPLYYFKDFLNNIYVFRRMENLINFFNGNALLDGEGSINMRSYYIKLGITIFKENPILGIGISNFGSYLLNEVGYSTYAHNNYIEILATTGIIGSFIYYVLMQGTLILRCKNITDNYKYLFEFILFSRLLMDFSNVSYYRKETYLIYALSVCYCKLKSKRKVHYICQ